MLNLLFQRKFYLFVCVFILYNRDIIAVPHIISFQGSVQKEGKPFEGVGEFKFAIVNNNNDYLWRNDGVASDGEPVNAINLQVRRGVFAVSLGDQSISNMAALKHNIFEKDLLFLRVWFRASDEVFEQLNPDIRITSVGFALMAKTVQELPNGIIKGENLGSELKGIIAKIDHNEAEINTLKNQNNNSTQSPNSTIVSGMVVASNKFYDESLIKSGYTKISKIGAPPWRNGAANGQPSGRYRTAGDWSGNEFLVWGGNLGANFYSNDGAIYNPEKDVWRQMSNFGSPIARESHTATWCGSELIIWGGYGKDGYLASGGAYNVSTDTWRSLQSSGQPTPRIGHVSVLGSKELFKINNADGYSVNRSLSVNPIGQGINLSIGDELIFSGGTKFILSASASTGSTEVIGHLSGGDLVNGQQGYIGNQPVITINNAAGYKNAQVFEVDRITNTIEIGVVARFSNGATLKLTQNALPGSTSIEGILSNSNLDPSMIGHRHYLAFWGGKNGEGLLGDGAIYDPYTNNWSLLNVLNGPVKRIGHTAIFLNGQAIVWGGEGDSGLLSDGGSYDFDAGTWSLLTNLDAPIARRGHSAISTGSEMIIWGGEGADGLLRTGSIFDPVKNSGMGSWSNISLENAPEARTGHSAIWTGTEMIVYGGVNANGNDNVTAAYNPVTNSWRQLTMDGPPLARKNHLAVWSGNEMIVYGGISNFNPIGALQKLVPQHDWYLYIKN